MPYSVTRKAMARAYLAAVRQDTRCVRCNGQPVEFHHPDHVAAPNQRVAHLAALGFPVPRIASEIAKCEALCRSCHMKEDGRSAALVASRPRQKGTMLPAVPCRVCGVPSRPTWIGACRRCYDKERRTKPGISNADTAPAAAVAGAT